MKTFDPQIAQIFADYGEGRRSWNRWVLSSNLRESAKSADNSFGGVGEKTFGPEIKFAIPAFVVMKLKTQTIHFGILSLLLCVRERSMCRCPAWRIQSNASSDCDPDEDPADEGYPQMFTDGAE